MSGIKLLFLAVLDEFKTLIFLSNFPAKTQLSPNEKHNRNNAEEKPKLEYEDKKQRPQPRIFPKDRNSVFHSSWVQNTVVSLVILFTGGIIGAFVFMRNPKVIVIGCAVGLTVIIWALVIAWFVESSKPKEERIVQFDSRIARNPADAPYPTNLAISGLTFDKSHADVRFLITPKAHSIQNVDFQIGFDHGISPAVIFGMGQVSQFPGVIFTPPEAPKTAIKILGEDGREQMIPMDAAISSGVITVKPFGPVWRIQCASIPNDSTLELILDVGQSPGRPHTNNWSPTTVEAWGKFDTDGSDGQLHSIPFHVEQLLKGRKNK